MTRVTVSTAAIASTTNPDREAASSTNPATRATAKNRRSRRSSATRADASGSTSRPAITTMTGLSDAAIADGSGNTPNGRFVNLAYSTAQLSIDLNDGLRNTNRSGNSSCEKA